MRIWLLCAAAAAALTLAPSATPSLQPYVAIVGCSNSSLIANAYMDYSGRGAAWDAAQGTYTLPVWATETAFTTSGPAGNTNPPFDQQLATFGQPSAVWYPVCVQAKDYTGPVAQQRKAAWRDFQAFVSLLRQRTQAPLYVTDSIADQESPGPGWNACANDQDTLQAYVVQEAVASGLAQRSSPDLPAASAPMPPGCHFDPVASTNVGQAAAAFIDQ